MCWKERQNDQRRLDPQHTRGFGKVLTLKTQISRCWPENTASLSSRKASGKRQSACSSVLTSVSPKTLTRWCARSSCINGCTSSTRHTASRQSSTTCLRYTTRFLLRVTGPSRLTRRDQRQSAIPSGRALISQPLRSGREA